MTTSEKSLLHGAMYSIIYFIIKQWGKLHMWVESDRKDNTTVVRLIICRGWGGRVRNVVGPNGYRDSVMRIRSEPILIDPVWKVVII